MPTASISVPYTFYVVTHAKRAAFVCEQHGLYRHLLRHVHGNLELEAWPDLELVDGSWIFH